MSYLSWIAFRKKIIIKISYKSQDITKIYQKFQPYHTQPCLQLSLFQQSSALFAPSHLWVWRGCKIAAQRSGKKCIHMRNLLSEVRAVIYRRDMNREWASDFCRPAGILAGLFGFWRRVHSRFRYRCICVFFSNGMKTISHEFWKYHQLLNDIFMNVFVVSVSSTTINFFFSLFTNFGRQTVLQRLTFNLRMCKWDQNSRSVSAQLNSFGEDSSIAAFNLEFFIIMQWSLPRNSCNRASHNNILTVTNVGPCISSLSVISLS